MVKKVFLMLFAFVFISCQYTKSKDNKTENLRKTEKQSQKPTSASPVIPPQNVPEYRWDTITKITQTRLVPFLEKYGAENPETKVLIATDFGDIEIELFRDTPLHRAHFIRLVKLGYFDTTYFYRVIEDFVIQAGTSDNRITGKLRHAIGDFLIPKEFKTAYTHNYGAFAAAKFAEQNISKASSPFEFYIVTAKKGAHHLDSEHTVFGRVVSGMDVAEKIAAVKTDEKDWPVDNVELKIKVLE